MTKSATSIITLWNPATGKRHFIDDEQCSLTDVTILVSQDNIYANVQKEGRPCLMDFSLNDSLCWLPFHNQSLNSLPPSTPSSVQQMSLTYDEPNEEVALELEIDVYEKAKASIRALRRVPTSFNNDVSQRLRFVMTTYEERKFNGSDTIDNDANIFSSVNSLCQGKQVFGFPLHFGFSNVETILEDIKLTYIHENKHPDVEFFVSVKVFPYACGVYSVWVFVGTMIPL